MIAGLELTTITAQFQGQTVNAAQANPYSLQAVQEAMIDLQLNPQDCLLILRRSVNNELTAEVDPSPTAYIKALNATGLHVQGCLVYYGDDFTGSTDALEALTVAGVPTVLFFQPGFSMK